MTKCTVTMVAELERSLNFRFCMAKYTRTWPHDFEKTSKYRVFGDQWPHDFGGGKFKYRVFGDQVQCEHGLRVRTKYFLSAGIP